MKKLFAILTVATALVACNNGGENTNSTDSTTVPSVDTTTVVTPDTTTAPVGDTTVVPQADSAATTH